MDSGSKAERLILNFKEISKDDIPYVGGKGANLGEMYNAGFPVPPGFVITALTYKKFLEDTGIKQEMQEVLAELNVDDNDSLQSASKQIQTIIRSELIPEYIAAEITRAYDAMYKSAYDLPRTAASFINASREPPFVAVRSSATAEDLPQASFAGQQQTFLNVKGSKNVLEAVRDCWASLFTARAIFYREKNNFDHFKVFIAVVIQRMVDSTKSGVAFSVDPVSQDPNKIVIEAGFGLGEAVVSGSINPDNYVVSKDEFKILETKIMKKDFMIRRSPEGKNIHIDLEEPKSTSKVLDDEEIVQLAKAIKMIEDHYGGKPQDSEWAVEGKKLYIVQTRPITTLREKGVGGPEEKAIEPAGDAILTGLPASHGVISGTVKIVHDMDELDKVQVGDIMVTKMTDPDFVPAMKRASAIVTDEGGMTSHAAIVSREMGVPCIVGTGKASTTLHDGDKITVDATHGKVYMGEIKIEQPKEAETANLKPIEEIQTHTKIYMNLGIPDMIDKYVNLPFDGIGLMRLEFIIADEIKEHPLKMLKEGRQDEYVEKLANGIQKVAKAIFPRPVVIRFSDFKTNEYSGLAGGKEFEPSEENPMIGWRGVSRYVSGIFEPAFRLECKAIKKLRDDGLTNVHVMFPFVRNTAEVMKGIEILNSEGLERSEDFKIWLMAEVPSMAIIPEEFAKLDIDGASIGSNDLTQLTLGVDRDSQLLGNMGYFDERNPAVLHAISRIIRGFKKHNKTISLCGQSVSVYPEIAEFLVACGITSVSVNPDVVESVKRHIAEIEAKQAFLDIAQEKEGL
ncbi:MAG: phosphoenolpyruvate synthase [Candidatus Nanoarchaeia archaeon]|nr:phosphoenolpyruvate synthase [Candidatus Nanoarchaeia archaeon]